MKKYYILLLLISSIISCKEEPTKSSIAKDPMTYLMETNANLVLNNPVINSVTIGVYVDGKTFNGYFGEIDKGKGNKPDDNSIFEIASVSKTFAGIIAAHAVLDGIITLNDDIRKYLDGSYPNLEYQGRSIQIRDLLTHTSGIRRDLSPLLARVFKTDVTKDEKEAIKNYTRKNLFKELKNFKLDTIPGVRYQYSPLVGSEILAVILEKVYQKTYDQLINEFILNKAGMTNTKFKIEGDVINGYRDEGAQTEAVVIPMTGAGGGLKSTIPDLQKYIQFLLDDSNPAIKEMQRFLYADEEEDEDYGYFWRINNPGFLHNGGTGGSTNWLIVLPQYKLGFTVFFNTNGDTSGDLINDIAGSLYRDLAIYPKKNPSYLIEKEIKKGIQNGIQFYQKLKKEEGTDFYFNNGAALNKIAYGLMREDKNADAIEIFKYIVSEFPNEYNPYDSLGEGYFMDKQYDLALLNYKRSLELNPENDNAERMIKHINSVKN
tara:strand:+ start:43996 stop:45462 length:1467 start_codon:yes stop_codon:yes gene_type:complete